MTNAAPTTGSNSGRWWGGADGTADLLLLGAIAIITHGGVGCDYCALSYQVIEREFYCCVL